MQSGPERRSRNRSTLVTIWPDPFRRGRRREPAPIAASRAGEMCSGWGEQAATTELLADSDVAAPDQQSRARRQTRSDKGEEPDPRHQLGRRRGAEDDDSCRAHDQGRCRSPATGRRRGRHRGRVTGAKVVSRRRQRGLVRWACRCIRSRRHSVTTRAPRRCTSSSRLRRSAPIGRWRASRVNGTTQPITRSAHGSVATAEPRPSDPFCGVPSELHEHLRGQLYVDFSWHEYMPCR